MSDNRGASQVVSRAVIGRCTADALILSTGDTLKVQKAALGTLDGQPAQIISFVDADVAYAVFPVPAQSAFLLLVAERTDAGTYTELSRIVFEVEAAP